MLSIRFSVSISMYGCGKRILKDIQLKVFPSYISDTSIIYFTYIIYYIYVATYALHICMLYIYTHIYEYICVHLFFFTMYVLYIMWAFTFYTSSVCPSVNLCSLGL